MRGARRVSVLYGQTHPYHEHQSQARNDDDDDIPAARRREYVEGLLSLESDASPRSKKWSSDIETEAGDTSAVIVSQGRRGCRHSSYR